MKRSSSWKSFQTTFASTPISTLKKKHTGRKNVNSSKSSVDESFDFHIEDSEDENVPCSTERRPPPFKRHRTGKSIKPLMINTSNNSSNTNNTTTWTSDTDESLSGEQPLRDVSECTVDPKRKKARSKSLLFLTKNQQNQLNCNKESAIPKDVTANNKKPQFNISKMFNISTASTSKDSDTIIESDSFDEMDSPQKKNQSAPKLTATPSSSKPSRHLTSEIVFSQSTQRSNPLIESENSQFSIKFDQTINSLPKKRAKTRKNVKGGLVERLNKVLSGVKSDFSYWMNERASNLVGPGEKLRIDKMERSYGRILLHCSSIEPDKNCDTTTTILCVDPAFKKLPKMQIGNVIEVGFDAPGYANHDGANFYPQMSKILLQS